jgi:phospholipase/carboxylesterase
MTEQFDGVEVETGADPRWSVIWLHGLGADGHDFEPIVPELVDDDWPSIRFVFPHAPVRAVTINGGVRMRAWYDILGLEIAQRQDESGVRESIAFVQQLIARENKRAVPSERVLIAGFSQGGAIALAAAVRHQQKLAGVAALSTYLPIAESTGKERSEVNRGLPVFMAHGNLDPVVGHALGLMSRSYLEGLGYSVEWHSYPMPHSVSVEEIADLATWLSARFSAGPG